MLLHTWQTISDTHPSRVCFRSDCGLYDLTGVFLEERVVLRQPFFRVKNGHVYLMKIRFRRMHEYIELSLRSPTVLFHLRSKMSWPLVLTQRYQFVVNVIHWTAAFCFSRPRDSIVSMHYHLDQKYLHQQYQVSGLWCRRAPIDQYHRAIRVNGHVVVQ